MVILALDTAGENCAVGLARTGDGISMLARRVEPVGRGHAERLLPMIGEVLAEAGMTYTNLERIAVTIGPGSFTGTRIGVAAARGLALALGIPAVGVSVLDALIEAARGDENGLVAAVLDARRREIYAKAVTAGSGEIVYDAQVTTAADLAQAIAGLGGRPVILTGSAASNIVGMLDEADISATIDGEAACVDISTVAALGMLAESNSPPVPLYLRPPDAKPQTGIAMARK